MRVMPRIGVVFDMRRSNCDASFPLFGGLINGAIFEETGETLFRLSLCDRGGQGCLHFAR